MERRDYLKKQIDQLGKVLGKILADFLNQKKQGKAEIAISQVNEVLNEELEFDINKIAEISEKNLVTFLKEEKKFNDTHIATLTDLIYQAADYYYENHEDEKAKNLYIRSLYLYKYLVKNDKVYSFERHQKIASLESIISEL